MELRHLSLLAAVLLILLVHASQAARKPSRSGCAENGDTGDDVNRFASVDLWRKQRVSLLVNWLQTGSEEERYSEYSSVAFMSALNDSFESLLQASGLHFYLASTRYENISSSNSIIETNITLEDREEVPRSQLMSTKLAKLLLTKLFDCTRECTLKSEEGGGGGGGGGGEANSTTALVYYKVHTRPLSLTTLPTDVFIHPLSPIDVFFDLDQLNVGPATVVPPQTPPTSSPPEPQVNATEDLQKRPVAGGDVQPPVRAVGCRLCERIAEAGEVMELVDGADGGEVGPWDTIKRALGAFVSILEPRQWLFLTLGVWLTCCLIIAMLIKRRDKQRLRLYLEEREAYSFSAKRS